MVIYKVRWYRLSVTIMDSTVILFVKVILIRL